MTTRASTDTPSGAASAGAPRPRAVAAEAADGGPAPAHGPADVLADTASRALDAGTTAARTGDLVAAAAALERCCDVAARAAFHDAHRTDVTRLHADALSGLAEIHLALGRAQEARATLNSAEGLYSRLGPDEAALLVADLRAQRARTHAALGCGLSALLDAQSAVLRHVQAAESGPAQEHRPALARVLADAAAVQAEHGTSRHALAAAQGAATLLGAAAAPQGGRTTSAAPAELTPVLLIEVRMLMALGRDTEAADALARLARLAGPRAAGEAIAAGPGTVRPGLTEAVLDPRVAGDTRAAVSGLLLHSRGKAVVPGLMVEPLRLLDAAREGAATALALAADDPASALAAGRDAACLYAFAEELGLVEHPWPQVRMELARWLWLLSELGWLALSLGDAPLAQDYAAHAQHPLVRAQSGRHLPSSIARSVNASAGRLAELRRALH